MSAHALQCGANDAQYLGNKWSILFIEVLVDFTNTLYDSNLKESNQMLVDRIYLLKTHFRLPYTALYVCALSNQC